MQNDPYQYRDHLARERQRTLLDDAERRRLRRHTRADSRQGRRGWRVVLFAALSGCVAALAALLLRLLG